jgi:hypothetical protein
MSVVNAETQVERIAEARLEVANQTATVTILAVSLKEAKKDLDAATKRLYVAIDDRDQAELPFPEEEPDDA